MILVGQKNSRIEFDDPDKWILKSSHHAMEAFSLATKTSFVIGKNNWTISKDDLKCNRGQPYNKTLKLTGCAEDEFTCDDGQCIKMERRCDQVTGKEPNCREESD